MTRGRSVPGAVVIAVGAGLLIYGLWPRVGLPSVGVPGDAPFPGVWRWFFAVWLPLLFPVYTLVHARLATRGEAPGQVAVATRRGLLWDRRTYAGLPVFLGLLLAWKWLPDWRLAFGAVFVGLLFLKTAGLVLTLYRVFALAPDADGQAEDAPILPRKLFLAAFLLYAFLAPYVVTAVSTTGDEHLYLLTTVSVYTDHDLDITNNVERRDWEKFYWGRPSPSEWQTQFVAFPALLLPGYAVAARVIPGYPLAGRLGATLTIAFVAAFLGVQLYRLCRELGASRPAAFWAWLVVVVTPPILVNASHLYPDLPAALVAVVGMRGLLHIPGRSWSGMGWLVAAAASLALLKIRFMALGIGLVLSGLARLTTRRVGLGVALIVGLVGPVLFLSWLDPWWLWSIQERLFGRYGYLTLRSAVASLRRWDWRMTEALVGMLADQEFGLFYYGPHWALALIGVVLLWRRSRATALLLLGAPSLYLVVLAQQRWMQWDAGWTPPPRFILSVAPLLVPFIAETFERGRGRLLAAVNTVWLVWCGVIAFVLAVIPFWRYNGLTGRSTLLQVLGQRLGLDLARFLPSVRVPNPWTWTLLAVAGLGLVAACVLGLRRRDPGAVGWGIGAVVLSPIRAVGLVVALALVWLAAAALVPTAFLEAVAMRHSSGIQFGSYTWDPNVWVMKRNGEISERIVTWPGQTEISIVAGGFMQNGSGGQMTLLLDGQPVRTWVLEAGRGQWTTRTYVATARTAFGRPLLSLRFTDLADQHPSPQGLVTQHALVGQIRLRRVAPGSPG